MWAKTSTFAVGGINKHAIRGTRKIHGSGAMDVGNMPRALAVVYIFGSMVVYAQDPHPHTSSVLLEHDCNGDITFLPQYKGTHDTSIKIHSSGLNHKVSR